MFVMAFNFLQSASLVTIISDDCCGHIILKSSFEGNLVSYGSSLSFDEVEGGVCWKLNYLLFNDHLVLNDFSTLQSTLQLVLSPAFLFSHTDVLKFDGFHFEYFGLERKEQLLFGKGSFCHFEFFD